MYDITPILCDVLYLPPPVSAYMHCGDREIPVPVFSFLLTAADPADDTAVLVDTGMEAPDSDGLVHGRQVGLGRGFEPLREGLEERGLSPTDVDYVVLSHLHHDHAAHTDRFTEAEVVVQRAELDAAADPLPTVRRAYNDDHREALADLDTTVVDGDHELLDGIELLFTPGHTEGSQSLVVETPDGQRVVAADVAYSSYNLDPTISSYVDADGGEVAVEPRDLEYWPPGIFVDLAACYESVRRLRRRVPDDGWFLSHDVNLMQ